MILSVLGWDLYWGTSIGGLRYIAHGEELAFESFDEETRRYDRSRIPELADLLSDRGVTVTPMIDYLEQVPDQVLALGEFLESDPISLVPADPDRTPWGRIESGFSADLLLLGRNPLVEISATEQIEGVALAGRWHTRDDLLQIEQRLRARQSSLLPHAQRFEDALVGGDVAVARAVLDSALPDKRGKAAASSKARSRPTRWHSRSTPGIGGLPRRSAGSKSAGERKASCPGRGTLQGGMLYATVRFGRNGDGAVDRLIGEKARAPTG